jgi:hypothetical protein
MSMARAGWCLLVVVLYALHQDAWLWRAARPLLFGFLPAGLAYHALYCVAAALLMWGLTTFAWPAHLDDGPALSERGGARVEGPQ